MDGTQKKMKLSRKVITHPSFASFFVCKIRVTLLDLFITQKNTKNTDSHPAVLLNSFKCCAPVVFV